MAAVAIWTEWTQELSWRKEVDQILTNRAGLWVFGR